MNNLFQSLLKVWAREPALVVGLVLAVVTLLVSFGVPISGDRQTAIRGVVEAVGVIIAALIVRSQVTPV